MDDTERMLREQARALWATLVCFVVGAAAGTLALLGAPRPFAGDGSVIIPAGLIAGVIAGGAFVVSTLLHRRAETAPMPGWQTFVSRLSTVAVTVALIAVTGLGVLLAGEVLERGLQGLELPALGGGLLVGVASAVGGRLSFAAGVALRTRDIAALLFAFLVIGTLFAMLTATDPTWWQRNFSQLGSGVGAWAFNGTLIIAGLLIATTGSYIGRDLHRLLGDPALPRIAAVVIVWAATGAALAAIGVLPVNRLPVPHLIAAFAALVLVLVAAVLTTLTLPGPPAMLRALTVALIVVVLAATALVFALRVLSATALESIVIGLVLLWLTTFVRVLAIVAPEQSRPSSRRRPLRRPRPS